MASLGMVFEDYPDEVICYVTDPKTGVQRSHKFPPAISEIVEALDAQMAHLARIDRYKNWGNNEAMMIEPPRENRMTLEEMKKKYGENWGLTSLNKTERAHDRPAPSWDKIAEMYQSDPSLAERLNGKRS
jgi:hypothetical protein